MNRHGVRAGVLLCVLALTAVSTIVAGCAVSAEPPAPKWEKVTSGRISGDRTAKQLLGTFFLDSQTRLAWDLNGPSDARAEFELMITRVYDANSTTGSGTSLRSWKAGFALHDDDAMSLRAGEPDEYHVTLTQRLRPSGGSGFSGTFTLYTQVVD